MVYDLGIIKRQRYIPKSNTFGVGGTIVNAGGYVNHIFTSSGAFIASYIVSTTGTIVTPSTFAIDYLVVAGGGGGGAAAGAGGGAGGFLTTSGYTVSTGTAYTVTVGAGGAGSTAAASLGSAGSNSVFSAITAIGGGGGQSNQNATVTTGGSGGGSAGTGGGSTTPGNGTAGQGNNGGTRTVAGSAYGSGGGGGAGGVGGAGSGTTGGAGGTGTQSSITGTPVYYAGGGGGGTYAGFAAWGVGGLGGGGTATGTTGGSGTINRGGGGGGGGQSDASPGVGGNGGSGIVVLKVPNRYTASFSVGVTVSTSTAVSGYNIYSVTAGTGTTSFTPVSSTYVDVLTTIPIEVLMVGGGGGGGAGQSTNARGGGGGAGAVLFQTSTIVAGASNTITVGAGGAGGISAGNNGTNGGTTVAFSKTLLGGGGGGAWVSSGNPYSGGSGGGAGTPSAVVGTSTQFATYGYGLGFAGGISNGSYPNSNASSGGGGGGSGGAGTAGVAGAAGRGGTGTNAYSAFLQTAGMGVLFTGTSYIAGGGGGGGGTAVGIGGIGGGGNGAFTTDVPSDATIFTGSGGGGGGGSAGGSATGGAGASGIVIIRYPSGINNDTLYDSTDPYFSSNALLLSNQSLPVNVVTTPTISYLVVGGGGGGGTGVNLPGGGGGAGGFRTASGVSLGSSIVVTVGPGGAASTTGTASSIVGTSSISAAGGGRGATGNNTSAGGSGGSGGGGGYADLAGAGNVPATTPSQGNNGGAGATNGTNNGGAGGGGGAGAVGVAGGGGTAGAGGAGSSSSISGSSVTYAGGGGGGGNNFTGGAAGAGGGGQGGTGIGVSGTAFTGGGGGGGGTGAAAGLGGSGIVIISYPNSFTTSTTTGSPTAINTGGNIIYIFTSSGSINLPTPIFPTFYYNTNTSFIDSSANALTITTAGTPTQGTFSPYGNNWSYYFNGSDSFINTPTNSSLSFGTNNFTIECWIMTDRLTGTSQNIIDFRPLGVNSVNYLQGFLTFSAGIGYINIAVNGAVVLSSAAVITTINSWYHIAIVRNAGIMTIYINGVNSGSAADTNTYLAGTNRPTIGSAGFASPGAVFSGYISNLRILNSALYTANFTPSTSPLTMIANTAMLTAASNRFIDKSGVSAITPGGTGTVAVSRLSPFAQGYAYNNIIQGGSAYFNGSSNLNIVSSLNFAVGTGNYTFEAWIYPIASAGSIFETSGGIQIGYQSTTQFGIAQRSVAWRVFTSTAPSLNAWSHVVIVRFGTGANQTAVFVNGIATFGTDATDYTSTAGTATIGATSGGGSNYFTGYISNLRFVKGTAVYTTAFTPPAAPVPAIDATTSTSVLLNFTNPAIYDATMQTDVITLGSSTLSTTSTKYNPRSMYFNGTNSYLSLPTINAHNFGTGDFTVEFWMNATAAGTFVAVVGTQSISGNTTAGMWRISNRQNSVNGIYFNYTTGAAFTDLTFSTTNYNDGTWHHVAACRASGTLRMFVDGNSLGTPTTVTQNLTSAQKLYVGFQAQDSQYYTGYIDDLRISRVARYTANFIPPTIVPKLK